MAEFDAEAHVAHMAEVLGLTIQEEWRDGVVANMANTARLARLVMEAPIGDDVEPATVFEP